MDLNITIRNININSISTLGSMNVGKVIFTQNTSKLIKLPKPYYEEKEFNAGENTEQQNDSS